MLPLRYRPRRLPLRFSMVTAGGREQAKDAQPGVAANGGSRRTGSLCDAAGGQSDWPAASCGSALTEEEVAVEQGSRIGCAARRVEPAAKEIRRPLLGLPQELQRVPPHVHPQRPAPPRPLFFAPSRHTRGSGASGSACTAQEQSSRISAIYRAIRG